MIRPPRIRLNRISALIALLSVIGIYYLFFSAPSTLPDELLDSPIFHPVAHFGTARRGGRWARKLSSTISGAGGADEEIGLAYTADGLVRGWDVAHDLLKRVSLPKAEKRRVKEVRDTHPIEELIQRGRERWAALLSR
jgi:hypothetical protein